MKERWLIKVWDGKYIHEVKVVCKVLLILDSINTVKVDDVLIEFCHMEILGYERLTDTKSGEHS